MLVTAPADKDGTGLTARQKVIACGCVAVALLLLVTVSRIPWSDQTTVGPYVGDVGASTAPSDAGVSTSTYRAAAKELVRQRLRDPSSAEFTDLSVHKGGGPTVVCGQVNARNGFGGMSGSQRFIVGPIVVLESEVGAAEMDQVWAGLC